MALSATNFMGYFMGFKDVTEVTASASLNRIGEWDSLGQLNLRGRGYIAVGKLRVPSAFCKDRNKKGKQKHQPNASQGNEILAQP